MQALLHLYMGGEDRVRNGCYAGEARTRVRGVIQPDGYVYFYGKFQVSAFYLLPQLLRARVPLKGRAKRSKYFLLCVFGLLHRENRQSGFWLPDSSPLRGSLYRILMRYPQHTSNIPKPASRKIRRIPVRAGGHR